MVAINKGVVTSYLEALNAEDFDTARSLVTDDLIFEGVLGTRSGAENYFTDMRRMKFKYNIKKMFADGGDVCVLYDIDMGNAQVFSCGWYRLEEGKIKWFRVVFDPRPVLERKG